MKKINKKPSEYIESLQLKPILYNNLKNEFTSKLLSLFNNKDVNGSIKYIVNISDIDAPTIIKKLKNNCFFLLELKTLNSSYNKKKEF